MEQQKAQDDNRFLKGRHVTYMTYDHFKISGTGEALLRFNDRLRVQLTKDNVQGFDTKWDEILPKDPDEDILENFCTTHRN